MRIQRRKVVAELAVTATALMVPRTVTLIGLDTKMIKSWAMPIGMAATNAKDKGAGHHGADTDAELSTTKA